jgi:hypothetical protein
MTLALARSLKILHRGRGEFGESGKVITGRTQTRTIRRRVLSAYIKSALADAKITAVLHADGGFRLLATAFDTTGGAHGRQRGLPAS